MLGPNSFNTLLYMPNVSRTQFRHTALLPQFQSPPWPNINSISPKQVSSLRHPSHSHHIPRPPCQATILLRVVQPTTCQLQGTKPRPLRSLKQNKKIHYHHHHHHHLHHHHHHRFKQCLSYLSIYAWCGLSPWCPHLIESTGWMFVTVRPTTDRTLRYLRLTGRQRNKSN